MRWKRIGVALGLLLALTTMTSAHEIFQGDQCVIDAETIIDGDVLVLCRALRVDGTIEGSLFGAALTAEINGSIRDDIYMVAGQLDVRGEVGEDIIFGGPVLQIHPTSQFTDDWGHLISLSLSSRLLDGARIPASVTSVSYQLLLDGDIGRDVSFWGSALRVNGTVAGDIDATVGDAQNGDASQLQTLLAPFRFEVELIDPGLIVSDTAQVDGDLRYTAPVAGSIEGQLASEAIYTPIVTLPDFTQIDFTEEENAAWLRGYISGAVREFVSLLVLGSLGLLIIPRAVQIPLQTLRWRPINSVGVGIMSFFMSFVVWIVTLLLLALLVIIFLVLNLSDLVVVTILSFGLLNVGAASLFFFLAFYVSRILVALAVGRFIVRVALGDDGSQRIVYLSLAVGTALISLVVWLPLLGWIFNALALVLGLGALVLTVAATQFRSRSSVPPRASVGLNSEDSHPMPPPMLDLKSNNPGMENLPQGFRWWNDED